MSLSFSSHANTFLGIFERHQFLAIIYESFLSTKKIEFHQYHEQLFPHNTQQFEEKNCGKTTNA